MNRAISAIILCLSTHIFALEPGSYSASSLFSRDNQVVSRIQHIKAIKGAHVQLGTISTADALQICPLETMPPDLSLAVNNLVEHVRNSVSKIKASQSSSCQALKDRLASSQNQLSNAINYHFIAKANLSSNMAQDKINAQTQQASAVNLLVLTASDLMQHQCIESIDDRIVIQRLLGQIISIGGLLYGGWQGIMIASGGQLINNLPLFRSEIDKALEVFQKYDEVNERGSFLCLFRQMQKSSCLMFASFDDKVVNGMDMSMQTGPAKTTKDSIDKIVQESPGVLKDVIWLRKLDLTAEPLISNLQKPDGLSDGIGKSFEELRKWCLQNPTQDLQSIFLHPEPVHESNEFIKKICMGLNSYDYPSPETLVGILGKAKWSFLVMANYYHDLKKDNESYAAMVAKTWESFQYFDNFKKTVEEYQTSSIGNQRRLNYFNLVRSLEDSLAKASFTRMMDSNHQIMIETKLKWLPKRIRLTIWDPKLSDRIRKRALIAMIDLCQTIDPTLACLSVGPELSNLHQEWKKRCVGPKSQLCHPINERHEKNNFLADEPGYRSYFDSLCGKY